MKIKTMAYFKILAAALLLIMLLTGFTSNENDPEYEKIAALFIARSEIMQNVMFDSSYESDDIAARLSEIEVQPLLKDDWQSVSSFNCSDCDRIVNTDILYVTKLSKNKSAAFYEVSVMWYMSGHEGHYTQCMTYKVKTITVNQQTKLSEIQFME